MPNTRKGSFYNGNFSDVSDETSNLIPNCKNHQSKLNAWIGKWEDKDYENDVRGSQIRELKYFVSSALSGVLDKWEGLVKKTTREGLAKETTRQNQSVGK